jgi:hypothetical protein
MTVPPFVSCAPLLGGVDHGTKAGAEAVASRIMKLWHAHGHPDVRAWVVPRVGPDKDPRSYDVRTNLINGLPPGRFGLSAVWPSRPDAA